MLFPLIEIGKCSLFNAIYMQHFSVLKCLILCKLCFRSLWRYDDEILIVIFLTFPTPQTLFTTCNSSDLYFFIILTN